MNKYEKLAADIIDRVSDVVESQHPELKRTNKITKEIGIEEGDEAVICGEQYYSLELEIARNIKDFCKKQKRKV